MSTQYNGNAANVSANLPTAINIAFSTATNPIVIGTSVPHGLTTGDTVDISGHQTNLPANGVNVATVAGLTSFSIPVNGTASSPGGATGTVQSLGYGVTFPVPANGDRGDGPSVAIGEAALGDRTAFLLRSTGQYKLASILTSSFQYGPSPSRVFATIPYAGSGWSFPTASGGAPWAPINFTGQGAIVTGDIIEVTLLTNYSVANLASIQFALALDIFPPGGSPSWTSANNAWAANLVDTGASLQAGAISLTQTMIAGSSGNLAINLGAQFFNTSIAVSLVDCFSAVAKVWRPTLAPQ
jgi:hypothetical protein